MKSIWSAIRERWQAETDGAGLAVVRMAVGIAVLLEMIELWISDGVAEYIIEPQVEFKYGLFTWVGGPQGLMPHVLVWVLMGLAVAVALGWRTRITAALLAVGYAYWFLIDAANYSDHGYLVCLLLTLVACLPTNRWASADAYMGRENRTAVSGWTVELMRTQLMLIYFFFGLALINRDWLSGAPLVPWVETEVDTNVLARLISGQVMLICAVAWFLPVLFLVIGPLLCWKRTRVAALIVLTLVQIFDQLTFQISISPLLLIAANLIFVDPVSLRRIGDSLASWTGRLPLSGAVWRGLCKLGWIADACVSWFDDTPLWGSKSETSAAGQKPVVSTTANQKLATPVSASSSAPQWAIALWLLIQIWMPLRHVTIESNPDWSDLATTFAWRGQHRDKQCDLKLFVIQPSQELEWPLDPTDEFPVPMAIFFTEEKLASLGLSEGLLKDLIAGPDSTLADRIQSMNLPDAEVQRILNCYRSTISLRLAGHQYEQLVQRPELIRQYAHRLFEVLSRQLGEPVQIQVDLQVRLNHRPPAPFFRDRTKFDLAEVKDAFALSSKMVHVQVPLPELEQRVAFAKEWAEDRRFELEQDFDIVSPKHPAATGEPVKLPAISDDDERWFQEKYGSVQGSTPSA
jgi:vitamin K-dependent gamma-carboxylase